MDIWIGICDDSQEQLQLLETYINRYPGTETICLIRSFSGAEFLGLLQDHPVEIAILDIEMEGLNGIEVGNEIRRQYPDTLLIYLTGFRDYALEAFQLESFQYLMKPVTMEQFHKILEKAILRLKERQSYLENSDFFAVRNKNQLLMIPLNDIYYFERQGKKVIIVTENEKYEFIGSLKSVTEQIEKRGFFRCHHGYVVNEKRIWEIRGAEIIFRHIQDMIPVSRRYRSEVLTALEKNLFGNR